MKRKPKKRMKHLIDKEYEDVIEFKCPVRGLVKQKVKVTRYKTLAIGSHQVVPDRVIFASFDDDTVIKPTNDD